MKSVKVKQHKRSSSIKAEINRLLFKPTRAQKYKELLTITVLKSKAKHFAFLRAYTHFDTVGEWEDYDNERNVMIEVEFKDTKDERVGKRLMQLFKQYNKEVVKEDLLYVRTESIEESTL